MLSKNRVHLLCVSTVPLFVILSGYFLLHKEYLYSLLSLGGVVLCMETRVRMGYRGPRKALFVIHLICCIGLLMGLVTLIISPAYEWMYMLSSVLFGGMVGTGALLIRQSWHPVY